MNKKYRLLTLSISALLLVGCNSGNDDKKPIHNYDTKWSSNADEHWKKCLDEGCTSRSSVDDHDYEGVDWIIDTYADGTNPGTKHRNCNICGYVESVSHDEVDPNAEGSDHTHTYATTWSSDDTHHWHQCTVTVGGMSYNGMTFGGTPCDATKDKATHTWNAGEVTTAPGAYSEGVKTYKCTVCNKTKTETIPATGPGDETIGNFTFNSDITTAQKIHTTNQENFLKFTGDYYNITSSQLNSYSATGNSEASFPNQVKVTWNYTAPAGKTVKNYTFITGQKADLSDGYQMTATTTQLSFYNAFLGTNYFKVIANLNDNSTEASEIKTFLVDATAPRNLKVGTMSNCRDMGGRTTVAGGKIKQGLIYRTSDPATSGVGDVSEWTKRMKIKTEIYVKDGSNSSGPLGSSVKFVNASMDYGATPKSNMARNAERLRKVFSVLGDSSNYPVMYHCRIGTDRTGICAVAINGLLGVPFNEIIQDYSFSNFGKIDGQRYAHKTPDDNGDDIAKYIDEILALPGNDFQQKMTYALLSIGITAQTLQNVVDLLTDGTKVTIPSDISVFNGTKLTNNGGTKKTTSDYSAPDTYYEISGSSKSVSCTYNVTEAKEVSVIAYLGCTNSSTSTKLASGIDLKIDGSSKTIVDKTYFDAGFGRTKQSSRTGYMFSVLGKYSLTAGNHTITISGKNSDTFNIGSIAIVGGGAAQEDNPSGGNTGGNSGTDTTTHTYKNHVWGTSTKISTNGVEVLESTCSCGAKKSSFKALDGTFASGSSNKSGTPSGYLKLNSNGNSISYTFTLPTAINGTLYFDAMMDSYTGNASKTYQSSKPNGKTKNFSLSINGVDVDTTNTSTFGDMLGSEADPNNAGYSNKGLCLYGAVSLTSGSNTIVFTREASFNPLITNLVVIY